MKNVLLTFALTALVASGGLNWCFISGKMQRQEPDTFEALYKQAEAPAQPVHLARK